MSAVEIGLTICVCAFILAGYASYNSRNKRMTAIEKEETNQKSLEAIIRVVESFNRKKRPKIESSGESGEKLEG
nr:MAG TPA: NF-kappa-B-activating protein C-terminal domain [Caudoviricetes sp.]